MFGFTNPFTQITKLLSAIAAAQTENAKAHSAQLAAIIAQGKTIMQGEDDLKTAVAGLTAFASTVATELQTLQAAANTAAGDPDADIETLAQQVNALVATIKAAMPAPAAASGS